MPKAVPHVTAYRSHCWTPQRGQVHPVQPHHWPVHTALVDKTAGVTRDRHYGMAEWLGRSFRLIDTGGIMPAAASRLLEAVHDQTLQAIAEADVVLFVLDSREEITAADQDIASQLHKAGKTVLLVGNKAERATTDAEMTPLHRLGFGTPHWVSAEHGQGLGDLLDAVLTVFALCSEP